MKYVAGSRGWYRPQWHYAHEVETRAALDLISSGHFNRQEPGIFDATYFKLRELRLGYTLPASVSRFIGFSDASVAIIGRNLFLWAKQSMIDPETAFDTGNRQGVENGQLPTARSIGITMSVRP